MLCPDQRLKGGRMAQVDLGSLDRFQVRQRIRMMVNLYDVSAFDAAGAPTSPIAFVRQKRMAIKEDIRFYADESQQELLFAIKARTVFEFAGVHDVVDGSGTKLGVLAKQFRKSLLRSSWEVQDAAGQKLLEAQERSMFLAVLRRVWGFIPYLNNVPFFIPFHFEFTIDGQAVGSAERPIGLADKYVVDVAGIPADRLDRRLAIAFSVALDALQDR
jgi:hypothetical protein